MKLFLDSSVNVAACASSTGASRALFNRSSQNNWRLLAIPYVLQEVNKNLTKFPPSASSEWTRLRVLLVIKKNVLAISNPVLFNAGKDRPILLSAFAYADVLLTLDRNDFTDLLGKQFYGLQIMKPGDFLEQQRALGILR